MGQSPPVLSWRTRSIPLMGIHQGVRALRSASPENGAPTRAPSPAYDATIWVRALQGSGVRLSRRAWRSEMERPAEAIPAGHDRQGAPSSCRRRLSPWCFSRWRSLPAGRVFACPCRGLRGVCSSRHSSRSMERKPSFLDGAGRDGFGGSSKGMRSLISARHPRTRTCSTTRRGSFCRCSKSS